MVPPEVESHGFAMDVTVTEGRTGMVNVVVTQPARRRGVTVLSIRRDGVMPEESQRLRCAPTSWARCWSRALFVLAACAATRCMLRMSQQVKPY
jgi:hypothetical protein